MSVWGIGGYSRSTNARGFDSPRRRASKTRGARFQTALCRAGQWDARAGAARERGNLKAVGSGGHALIAFVADDETAVLLAALVGELGVLILGHLRVRRGEWVAGGQVVVRSRCFFGTALLLAPPRNLKLCARGTPRSRRARSTGRPRSMRPRSATPIARSLERHRGLGDAFGFRGCVPRCTHRCPPGPRPYRGASCPSREAI